jgi:hypothetical protein
MISPLPRTAQAQDALAVFESNGVVQTTTLDGKKIVTEVKFAGVSLHRRDRTQLRVADSAATHA